MFFKLLIDILRGNLYTPDAIEIISATRLSESEFWGTSPLGLSLRRLEKQMPHVAHIAFDNRAGLPDFYNARIQADGGDAILVFVHDDVWIDDYFLAQRIVQGLEAFDVIGVAGNRRRVPNQHNWSFLDDIFALDDAKYLSGCIANGIGEHSAVTSWGAVPAECELLDGVFLAARKSKLRASKVQFDPQFDFHFYDTDFCRSARVQGLRLGTWPICLAHQSVGEGSFGSPQWNEKYLAYIKKWKS